MAAVIQNIVSAILPAFAFDSVAIFTQDYTQVFKNARSIKAVVKEEAKVMQHPIETGATIVDHRIILPVEIQLSLILASYDYESVYHQIREYYFNSTLLTIQTRSGIYTNQLIQGLPHEEDPDYYNALTIALSLQEVQFVTAVYGTAPLNPSNVNSANRGVQQGTAANAMQMNSVLSELTGIGKISNPKGLS